MHQKFPARFFLLRRIPARCIPWLIEVDSSNLPFNGRARTMCEAPEEEEKVGEKLSSELSNE